MKHKVTVQAAGYISLPEDWLRKHDIRFGDKIEVIENPDGSLTLMPDDVILSLMLHEIGNVLEGNGVTLEQLLDQSDQIGQDDEPFRP